MRGFIGSTLALAGAVAISTTSSQAAVLIDNNFNTTTLADPVGNDVVLAGTTGQLRTRTATDMSVKVVDLGSGNRAVQFVDNSTATDGNNLRPVVGAIGTLGTNPGVVLSSDATGNNRIQGSFALTRLGVSSGTEGTFEFAIHSTGYATTFAATPIVLRIKQGQIFYSTDSAVEGGSIATSAFQMIAGTQYLFSIDADFSSTGTDSWSFSVAAASAPSTVLASANSIATWANNLVPASLTFKGGVNASAASSSPFMQLDNVHFEASPVPEPASLSLLALGAMTTLRRRAIGR